MPWEGGLIYVADVVNVTGGDGSISGVRVENAKKIAGQPLTISATYPSWAGNTTLVFTTDESGFQNPWKYSTSADEACPVFSQPVEQDFGGPAWTLGGSPYALLDSEGTSALFTAFKDGYNILYLVDLVQGSSPYQIDCPFTELDDLRLIRPGGNSIVFLGKRSGLAGKGEAPGGVVTCTISSSVAPAKAIYATLKTDGSGLADLPDGYISPPKPATLTVDDKPLYIVLYEPQNPAYAGSSIPGENPPCIINVHGGSYVPFYHLAVAQKNGFRANFTRATSTQPDQAVLYESRMGLVSDVVPRPRSLLNPAFQDGCQLRGLFRIRSSLCVSSHWSFVEEKCCLHESIAVIFSQANGALKM